MDFPVEKILVAIEETGAGRCGRGGRVAERLIGEPDALFGCQGEVPAQLQKSRLAEPGLWRGWVSRGLRGRLGRDQTAHRLGDDPASGAIPLSGEPVSRLQILRRERDGDAGVRRGLTHTQ